VGGLLITPETFQIKKKKAKYRQMRRKKKDFRTANSRRVTMTIT
jgi:hypothetical protein